MPSVSEFGTRAVCWKECTNLCIQNADSNADSAILKKSQKSCQIWKPTVSVLRIYIREGHGAPNETKQETTTMTTIAHPRKTLAESLPVEFTKGEFDSTKAYAMRDVKVVAEHTTPWIGAHKNVRVWYELENGYAVAWNENPSKGWGFPVAKTENQTSITYIVSTETESVRVQDVAETYDTYAEALARYNELRDTPELGDSDIYLRDSNFTVYAAAIAPSFDEDED